MPGMPWPLPWPFDTTYMQLALIAGLAVGASAPLIGTFLVQKRLSLLGDGIGHVAVAGVGGGLLFGTSPVWTALLVAVVAALALEWLRSRGRTSGDLALALFFYGGIAAGVVLAGRSATNANLQPYLFGSILTVTENDVYTVVALGVLIMAAIGLTRRGLLAVVLDEEAAHVAGIPVGVLNALLAALTAVTVAAAMRVTGVLLVAALMVLPVATSRVVARSFRTTTLGAGAVGMVAVVLGLAAARQWALAAGGAIVLGTNAVGSTVDQAGGPVAQMPTPSWEASLRINLTAPMWLVRAAIPHMIEAGHGSIVNISSRAAERASRGLAAYIASKGGLNALTRSIAVDYAESNVRCNTISPGYVLNERRDADLSEARRSRLEGMHLTRLGEASDVAYAAVYLASRESEFVTGVNLTLDGGGSAARGLTLG